MTSDNGQTVDTDGRDLGWWLWALVSDDAALRLRASTVLTDLHGQAMTEAIEAGRIVPNPYDAFDGAVSAAVAAPGFDARRYVVAVADLMAWAQSTRMAIYEKGNARAERILERATAREGEAARTKAGGVTPRMRRVICAGAGAKAEQQQSDLLALSMTAGTVFSALGTHALAAPDRLRQMLGSRDEAWHVTRLMEKLGPKAAVLADALIAQMDAAGPGGRDMQSPRALAAVIAGSAALVQAVADRLSPARPETAAGAAWTLQSVGADARRLAPACVDRLMALAQNAGCPARYPAVAALGTVTRGTDVAVDLLLELSRADDVWLRGAALTALGDAKASPDRVVPRLIEAFDDYDEQDVDLMYDSQHHRVADALACFGPAALPALPALVARVKRKDDPVIDRQVIAAIEAIGPAARPALPALEAVATELEYDLTDEGDDEFDAFARVIRTLRRL